MIVVKILTVFVFVALQANAMEIPLENENEADFDPELKIDSSEKGVLDDSKQAIFYDEKTPQNTFVQYDSLMQGLRQNSEVVLTGYGSAMNVTRDNIVNGMGGALASYNDWVKVNSKKYPELNTYPKLQEFTTLISTFSDTTHQSVKAFTQSYLLNVQDSSRQIYDSFYQKGHEVLKDIMDAPEKGPADKRCKSKHIRKFTTLGNAAFRQIDGCINAETRSQKRLQATTEVSLRNMKSYVRGVVDKLNICYVKDYYDRPLQCVDREVHSVSLNEFVNLFVGVTTDFNTGKLETCTEKARLSYYGKLNDVRNQVMTCMGQ